MTDIVKMTDFGSVFETFAYGIGRVDNMGSVTRIVFYTPNKTDHEHINEKVLQLIVPTDQLAKIAAALVQPVGRRATTPSLNRRDRRSAKTRAMSRGPGRQRIRS